MAAVLQGSQRGIENWKIYAINKLRSVQNNGTCNPVLGWICQVHMAFLPGEPALSWVQAFCTYLNFYIQIIPLMVITKLFSMLVDKLKLLCLWFFHHHPISYDICVRYIMNVFHFGETIQHTELNDYIPSDKWVSVAISQAVNPLGLDDLCGAIIHLVIYTPFSKRQLL